jgi:HEAT repeat protein
MNIKFIIIIPAIVLFYNCSSKKSDTKENPSTETKTDTKEIVIVNDSETKTTSTKAFSIESENNELKQLLNSYHEKYKNEVNLDILKQKMNSSDPFERRNGVKMLSYFPEYITLISKVEELLVNDKEAAVRNECAITISLLESKSSIPALIKALEDNDIEVKANSMEALAALGEKEQSFLVADKLWNKGKDGGPVQACQIAFRDIGTPEALERLEYDMNNNADENNAIGAAIYLAQLGHTDKTLAYFENALSNNDVYIRMAALRGLSYIGNEKALQLISSKTDDADELVRDRALSLKQTFESNN